jgi:hypothetical protein
LVIASVMVHLLARACVTLAAGAWGQMVFSISHRDAGALPHRVMLLVETHFG